VAAPRRCVVTERGAVGDGQTLNTKAIQAAIDQCSARGGGDVVVPKGVFLTGAIFLKKGVNLRIEKDGVLQGSTNPQDYPQVKTRWEGIEREWTSALVNAENLTGVELSGEGAIDGSGDQWLQRSPPMRKQPPSARPPAMPPPGPRFGRPRLVCFQNCRRVRVRNLTLRNQAVWCLHILYSEDVLVEGVTIRAAHNIPSSDGIDVDSSRKVRIARVDIDVNDDCITIKSGKDADGLRVNRPSEKIVIENSRFGYGHGGVAMGSETSGGIRNVVVRNCVMEAGNWAPIRFKSQPSRGGVVENIEYRDIKLRDTRQAFEFNMEWRMVPPVAPPAKVLPVVRNVKIVNVSGTASSVGTIRGLKDSPIENVRFRNCRIAAQKGLRIENARNVDLSGLSLEVKEGDPVVKLNVQ
jgi:polygalacturonase